MDMNKLMQQAQQMQKKFAQMQEELKDKSVQASAGGGAVTVTATGAKQITEIKIDKDAVDSEDIDMLQDMILAAVNEALKNAQEMVEEETKKLTGGMGIPGMF
ncbi:MAG TPA: YbaB/EbfC family nucleoid-associated protein [Firmicutes bacterium]|nr:YbaB/EbfC family nucleoid-associated protein [Bacillota bacterium]